MAPSFISTIIFVLAAIAAVNAFTVDIASPARRSALERRAAQVPVACYGDNSGDCDCPIDNNGDTGVSLSNAQKIVPFFFLLTEITCNRS
jgi:hypothetical protein